MNVKVAYVGSLYDRYPDLTRQEADAIMDRLSAGYDDVAVTEDFGNTDQYWFISISSVWHEQDLERITEESVLELVRQNIEYTYWVETYYDDNDEEESDPLYRIYIDIYDIGQDALMRKLGLDSFKTQWAGFLYQNQMGMMNDGYEASANGTHSEIKDTIQGDDTPLEGGSFGNPFPGTNWSGNITSYFGKRPYPGVGTGTSNHTGLDISAGTGTGICAVQGGTVLFVRDSGSSGYGKHLAINHGGGYVTLYAHCSQILVRQGQKVEAGQAIAKVGQTGWATGPHLHIEIIVDGEPKDPMGYDNQSLFEADGVSYKPMPTRADMLEVLSENPDAKNLALVESRFVTGSAKRLGQATNVDLDNQFVVIDTSEIGKDLLAAGTFTATDFCTEKCKESRVKKKALILDELWALIGASSNPQAAEFVLECFKTYRAFGAAVIGATQDLNDFFALENGKFGRAILNNSRIKVVLPLEEEEAVRVKEVMGLSNEEMMQVIRSKRGEGLLCAGHNRISVAFQSTQLEYDWITTSRADLEAQMLARQQENG